MKLTREQVDLRAFLDRLADSMADSMESIESVNDLFMQGICGLRNHANALASLNKPADGWLPIESRPNDDHATYLVANDKGQVAPWINGVIHNNVGTAFDWEFGEAITHWQPLPAAPTKGGEDGR